MNIFVVAIKITSYFPSFLFTSTGYHGCTVHPYTVEISKYSSFVPWTLTSFAAHAYHLSFFIAVTLVLELVS